MAVIISSIFTLLSAGFSTGGLLVSRRLVLQQSLLLFAGLAFLTSFYLGIIIGRLFAGFVSHGVVSVLFALFCFAFIAFLIVRYDPSFGFIRQEPAFVIPLLSFFFLLGLELAILELALWFSLIAIVLFAASLIVGYLFMWRLSYRFRNQQTIALIPLALLLFIGLFKLI